jgi:hypothetical protein
MKISRFAIPRFAVPMTGAVLVAVLELAAAHAQAGILVEPTIVIGVPGVVIAPQPMVEYAPNPFDVYITGVGPSDVVYLNGDTFIWAVDGNGRRYQRFYAHGDRRSEVMNRHAELQRVMARNGGRLPAHQEAHQEVRREGGNDEHRAPEGRPDDKRDDRRN